MIVRVGQFKTYLNGTDLVLSLPDEIPVVRVPKCEIIVKPERVITPKDIPGLAEKYMDLPEDDTEFKRLGYILTFFGKDEEVSKKQITEKRMWSLVEKEIGMRGEIHIGYTIDTFFLTDKNSISLEIKDVEPIEYIKDRVIEIAKKYYENDHTTLEEKKFKSTLRYYVALKKTDWISL